MMLVWAEMKRKKPRPSPGKYSGRMQQRRQRQRQKEGASLLYVDGTLDWFIGNHCSLVHFVPRGYYLSGESPFRLRRAVYWLYGL